MNWASWLLIILIIAGLSVALVVEVFRGNKSDLRQEMRVWGDFYMLTRKERR